MSASAGLLRGGASLLYVDFLKWRQKEVECHNGVYRCYTSTFTLNTLLFGDIRPMRGGSRFSSTGDLQGIHHHHHYTTPKTNASDRFVNTDEAFTTNNKTKQYGRVSLSIIIMTCVRRDVREKREISWMDGAEDVEPTL
jgi:hypothetical protein